jgi:hypothetical protein
MPRKHPALSFVFFLEFSELKQQEEERQQKLIAEQVKEGVSKHE